MVLPISIGIILGFLVDWISKFLYIHRKFDLPKQAHLRLWTCIIAFALLSVAHWNVPQMQQHFGLLQSYFVYFYFFLVILIDIEQRLIPHHLSLFGGLISLWLGISAHGIQETLIGGVVGFLVPFCLYLLGLGFIFVAKKLKGDEITEVVFGWGDVILSTVLGILLGWPLVGMGLLITIIAAGIYSVFFVIISLLARSYSRYATFAFGPFFVLGGFLILFLPIAAQALLRFIFPGYWLF